MCQASAPGYLRSEAEGWEDTLKGFQACWDMDRNVVPFVPNPRRDTPSRCERRSGKGLGASCLLECILRQAMDDNGGVGHAATFKLELAFRRRKLVPAERHPYAALSYLWGIPGENTASQNGIEARREQLPSSLPATIEDAILEEREVNEQIKQMDLVYQNAEITIIAAAGNGPSHGLPGVQSQSRLPQCRVEVGGHVLQSLTSPQLAILKSTWWTRGWNFQEGLLARRRLVFTDEQVYYECDSMYCCEALDVKLGRMQDLQTKGTKVFKRKYSVGSSYIILHTHTLGAFPRGVMGQNVEETALFISDYSCRCFTEPGDRLKGFLGVLRAMYATHSIQNFWGIPMIPRKFATPRRAVVRSAALPGGNPPATFLEGLCWKLVRPAERIRSLPSWSWVGWEGIVYAGWRLSAYREDGRANIDLGDFSGCQHGAKSAHIQITTWIAKATVLKQASDFASTSAYEATVEVADSEPVHWTLVPDTQSQLKDGHTYTCLYVGLYSEYPTEHWSVDVLVVDEVGEPQGCFERVGAGFLRCPPELGFPNDALQRAQFEDKIASSRCYRPCPAIWKERATITLK
ncbi:hypothetical protein ACJZ2D_013781 [Fusarium nematophilum]